MLRLLAVQFRLNLISNVFFMAQCVLVFLLANSTVSGILYGGFVGRYYTNLDKDRTIFLSSAVSNHVEPGDSEGFYRLVEDISAVDGVSGVGYQLEEAFGAGKNEDMIVSALILGEEMAKIQYPLSQGRWLDGQGVSGGQASDGEGASGGQANDGQGASGGQASDGEGASGVRTQVVLGGEVARLYETDEIITLYRFTGTDYVPVEATVVGKMREPCFAVSLNFASTQPEYVNLFRPYSSLILTDDETLVNRDDVRFPMLSLLVFVREDADVQAVKDELRRFGQPFDFYEVDEFYRAAVSYRLANQLPTTGIMVLGILFGLTGITYLGIYQNMKSLSVCYLYGMSRKGCAYMNMALNAAMLALSLLCAAALSFLPAVRDHLFRRAMFGAGNLIFSVLFIAAVMGVSFLVSCGFSRKSPIMTWRRFE